MRYKIEWLSEIVSIYPELSVEKHEILWNCLKIYLCGVFEQHGIQTIHLLNPSVMLNASDQQSLSIIIEKLIVDYQSYFSREIIVSSINQFIIRANEKRALYISQLADATFTSFALTSDAETVNFLNSRYNNLQLFLDTNFIFGVLDLHKNSEDASAREILDEVKKNKLPFKLTFHPETLNEFKRAFNNRALRIRATKWTRESSRVALAVDGLSPLEELFHKENLENEIDSSVFLDKYDHVDLILKDLGLVEFIPSFSPADEAVNVENDIEEYQKYYNVNPNRKTKSFYGFKHDIIVLREVRFLNPKKTKFLDSNAFFISSDLVLNRFEKKYYKKAWEINYVVTPSVFLQLIRPFIESDYQSNKRFIDTFSIPHLRAFEIDYTATRSKTLQILNDNYHDASFETKVKILGDQVLLEKMDKLNDAHDQQIALIESQIAVENQILAAEKEEVQKAIRAEMQEKEHLITTKEEIEKSLLLERQANHDLNNQVISQSSNIDAIKQDFHQSSQQLEIKHKNDLKDAHEISIASLKKIQTPLLMIAEKRYNWHKTILFSIPLVSYSIIFYLIFKLGWDKMEPVTYIISCVELIGGYLFLAFNGDSFDPRKYFELKKIEITSSVYKDFNFAFEELEELQRKKAAIEQELISFE